MSNRHILDHGQEYAVQFFEYLGVMYLAHSILLKYLTFTLLGTARFFASIGLPRWSAYATFFLEALGGVLLVVGVQARWVALALLPFAVGAVLFVHAPNGWVFTAPGGGWEYPAYLIVLSLAQFLLGDGRFALMKPRRLSRFKTRARSTSPPGGNNHDPSKARQSRPLSLRAKSCNYA